MTEPTKQLATTRQYRDDLGRVFDRMRIQYGECFDFPVGVKRDEADDFTWEWLSHVDYDGLGAVDYLARKLDHEVALPRLKIRREQRATWFDHVRPMLRRSYLRAAPGSPWDRPKDQPAPSTELRVPQHLIALSPTETREVANVARGLGVSVNSLLLWSLANAVRSIAVKPNDRQHWTVPVNMRGGTGVSENAANPLSFIRVIVRPGDTAQVVHARLYDLLETGMHWVMLGWITFFANRSKMKFPPVRSTGTFSNIGTHTLPGVSRLTICPPAGITEPIATSVITCNGVMTLAFSVHHSMNPPSGAVDAVGNRWRAAILSGST